jgi:beta-phosphoglucomutase-like phosphatase (HAD superfamily)
MANYVFDLEGTLFFTNRLNTICYNSILRRLQLAPIKKERVTRSDLISIYPNLSKRKIETIIKAKQKLFAKNVNKIIPNAKLVSMLKEIPKEQCVIWTSSNKKKARNILRHFNVENKFNKIINKTKDINSDVGHICAIFSCQPNELEFYEDDAIIVGQLKKLGCTVRT